MRPVLCPMCWTVKMVETPPGEPVLCSCLDNPPLTRPIACVRLRLPEGYEVVRKQEMPA